MTSNLIEVRPMIMITDHLVVSTTINCICYNGTIAACIHYTGGTIFVQIFICDCV